MNSFTELLKSCAYMYVAAVVILALLGLKFAWAKDLATKLTHGAGKFFWNHPRLTAGLLLVVLGLVFWNYRDGSPDRWLFNQKDYSSVAHARMLDANGRGFEDRAKELEDKIANSTGTEKLKHIAAYQALKADYEAGRIALGESAGPIVTTSTTPAANTATGALPTPTSKTYQHKDASGNWETIPEIDVPAKMEGSWRVTFPANNVYIPRVEPGQTITIVNATGKSKVNNLVFDKDASGPEGSHRLHGMNHGFKPEKCMVGDSEAKMAELVISTDGATWQPAYRVNRQFTAGQQVQFGINTILTELGFASGSITIELEIN